MAYSTRASGTEEDPNSVVERVDALLAGRGVPPDAGAALPVEFLIQAGVQIVDAEGNLDAAFEEQVREFQPDLIVIDPMRRVHSLDENDSRAMNLFFNALRQLTRVPDNLCSVLVVHHLRKRGEFDEGLDRLRGSTDIAASVDSVLEVAGEFNSALRCKHSKSKQGPAQGAFLIQTEIAEDGVRLCYLNPEAKAQEDREAVRAFVFDILEQHPDGVNKSRIVEAGKPRGFGKAKITAVLRKMVEEGHVAESPGSKNSRIFRVVELLSAGGRPPADNNTPDGEVVPAREVVEI